MRDIKRKKKPALIPTESKSTYKNFHLQMRECAQKINLFEVPCVVCNQVNLICAKYKAYCRSSLCRDERMTDKDKAEFYSRHVDRSHIPILLTILKERVKDYAHKKTP